MSVTVVQKQESANSGTDMSFVAFSPNITAGNVIAGFLSWNDNTVTLNTMSDTLGNNYTLLFNPTDQSAGLRGALFWAKSPSGGANTTVAHFSASTTATWGIVEVNGADATTPLDQYRIDALNNPGNGVDAVAGTAVTPGRNGSLILGGAKGKFGTTCSAAGTNGFTAIDLISFMNLEKIEDQTTAASIATKFTATAEDWLIYIMTFQPTGALTSPMFRGT